MRTKSGSMLVVAVAGVGAALIATVLLLFFLHLKVASPVDVAPPEWIAPTGAVGPPEWGRGGERAKIVRWIQDRWGKELRSKSHTEGPWGITPEPDEPDKAPPTCSQLGVLNLENCLTYAGIIDNLLEVPLAYNRPDRMTLGEGADISLTVDPREDPDPKADLEGLEGPIVEGTTKIARYMSAELYGSAFLVVAAGPQRKLVVSAAPTRWTWTVTPQDAGDDKLLTLDIHVHIQDGEKILDPVTVRTFRDRILVDVTTWKQITSVVKELEPIHAFFVALIGSLSGLLAWVWQRSRSKGAQAASDAPRRSRTGKPVSGR